jgi:hypothetical protein
VSKKAQGSREEATLRSEPPGRALKTPEHFPRFFVRKSRLAGAWNAFSDVKALVQNEDIDWIIAWPC